MAKKAEVLALRKITRSFGENVVLREVSLSLREEPGWCAVVGPNGAGKTTLLRCVAGTIVPDGGQVMLLGQPVDESQPHAGGDRDRPGRHRLLPDLSVSEHLELMAYAHGTNDALAVVEETLTALSLEGAKDEVPPTLSSGQRRRLALASCFVRPRKLLILDEPEQRLDVKGRTWLAEQLRREKASGTAVIMASHDVELVDAVADIRLAIGE